MEFRGGRYETARGRDRKSYKGGLCLGKGQGKQQWEKLVRTERKDNQLVWDGITILTVMGTDSIEKEGDNKDTEASR